MKKNSSNSTPNEYQISDEVRDLIIRYMEACNEGKHAEAEVLLHKIKQQNNESHD